MSSGPDTTARPPGVFRAISATKSTRSATRGAGEATAVRRDRLKCDDRPLRYPASLLALALALAASACGSASPPGGSESRPAPKPRVTLTASTHRPLAGAPWPILIRAFDRDGKPLRAAVRYEFLFSGSVVARRSHHRFRGTFRDTIRWPARSVGIPLVFRAVVTTPLGNRHLDYAVRVRR